MTYKVNGTAFIIEPTSGRWLARTSAGEDGFGHSVYFAPREYELRWDMLTATGAYQLQQFFNSVGSTGTVVVSLPKYANYSYVFYDYSGCVLQEPSWGQYFVERQLDCTLLITNIRT